MTKRSLFAKSLFLAIFFVNIHEYRAAYNNVKVTVEPLHPIGLRMSIPDEQGIKLVAFHAKINENFNGLEAGTIARDILTVRDGRWTYQDSHTQLERDDIIYMWIHVIYRGLGYNTVNKSHRVTDFYNDDGTKYTGDKDQDETCTGTSVTWVYENGGQRQACSQELLFEDHFDTINTTTWNSINRFAGAPDYEFVIYMTNDVTDTKNGWLRITPIPLETKFSNEGFILNGELEVEGCTEQVTSDCRRRAIGSFILPPVISGRLNTKGKFEFLFGRIEIKARLPRGDWVYPLLTLESAENTWEFGLHREIRIASSMGNEALTTPDHKDISGHILRAGGLTSSLNESGSTNWSKLPKRLSSKTWADEPHIFEIEWSSGLIVVKVDEVEYGQQTVDTAFGKQSYLTLGIGVGGIHEFPDYVTSSGYTKPWRNVDAQATYKFYQAKDKWHRTWNTDTALKVDYVKIWAL
ncbi:Beta-1,3-glucan-binding protein [Camponotus floridanus]|uniref:Beta-1,3-glucan-binding protein n=1 Tax=Camponotus floridanus TaxID=104421 RepID=E2AVH4_CAMFO|nr:beta-1,3-glucan-binding protein [Camponotus floridanus]XP_011264690.1 beta-1,3-glucan-binding protein [Camponotus floridanus]EFN62569.1 Beta-1,3-glucan-binding protein [Camponotus floridanus]